MKRDLKEPIAPLTLLMAGLAVAWVPHAQRFPAWLWALLSALLAARWAIARYGIKLPGRKWLIPPTILGIFWSIYYFRPFFGGAGALALLTVMGALKLFEMREHRDRTVMVLVGYVLVATRFLYEQTPATSLWMLGLAFLFTYVLADYADRERERGFRIKLVLTGTLIMYAIPVAVLLFVVFPRTGTPLFMIRSKKVGETGLSDSMAPGTLSGIILSDAIAFRAEIEGDIPAGLELYWRGPVFDSFDGKVWKSSAKSAYPPAKIGCDARVRQKIVVEERSSRWLTPLDYPLSAQGLKVSGDGVVTFSGGGAKGGAFEALSCINPVPDAPYPSELQRALRLPSALGSKTRDLAKSLSHGSQGTRETAARVMDHFRRGGFTYTLTPPELSQNPTEEFLFGEKSGFCEHYASATAVLLRSAGVPARVVTGYLGGEYNPFGDHWIVEQRHAHAWVEAWDEGAGWLRIDPTTAVSPERLGRTIDFDASMREGVVRFGGGAEGIFLPVLRAFDSFGFWWNEWVVGFGPVKQRQLLEKFGLKDSASGAWLKIVALAVPVLWVGAVYALVVIVRKRRIDPAERAWGVFCGKLERGGVARLPHEPPFAYARRAGERWPGRAGEFMEIAVIYSKCRYGRLPKASEVVQLKRMAVKMKIPRDSVGSGEGKI